MAFTRLFHDPPVHLHGKIRFHSVEIWSKKTQSKSASSPDSPGSRMEGEKEEDMWELAGGEIGYALGPCAYTYLNPFISLSVHMSNDPNNLEY